MKIVKIYCVPVLDIHYRSFYDRLPHIFKALTIAFKNNCVVAHNGAVFDFFIFAYKYGIPIGRNVYDTLVANHRIYPEVEKSLGHCISLHTYLPYHKNEGTHEYRTLSQAEQLWSYCNKDVYGMMLVHLAQLAHASKDSGLMASIEQAMRSIRPYLICSLTGIKYNEEKRKKWIENSDKLMMQYMRIMQILHGKSVEPLISNKKCVEYFHNRMGYSSVKRTPKGNPSLSADALFKLRLHNENPVIDTLLAYRRKQKETGVLGFKPWITEQQT